mgnify:CR=1 FL=1
MIFWIVFVLGTAAFIIISWRHSIKARRYHGVARFFAFESILALFLLNIGFWFKEPFTFLHIFSWIFLAASLFLAIQGVYLLKKLGQPEGQFENTTRLVVSGAYKFIRHPLYGSLAFLGLGIFLKRVTSLTLILAFIDLAAVYLTARIEEREMLARFGDEYAVYVTKTKMFIPFLI